MTLAEELFSLGMTLLKQREVKRAVEVATDGVQSFPENGDLWELLGVCQFHAQNSPASCEALEEASLLKPLDVGARFCLAGAYAGVGRRELAVDIYRLIADDEQAPICLLPKVAARLGQMLAHAEALDVCRTIVRRDPDHHGAHFGIAFYLRQLGSPLAELLPQIARAQELAPDVPLYRIALASIMQELGESEVAGDLLRDLSPDTLGCPWLLKRMALLLRVSGDHARARDCARRLRQVESNDNPPDAI
jgi:tetratricopeptide (TPR) repeat protein